MILLTFVLLYSIFTFGRVSSQRFCINPNQNTGTCVSIYNCTKLISELEKEPNSDDIRQFLLKSKCENGIGIRPFVCCSMDMSFLTTTEQSIRQTTKKSFNKNQGKGNILPNAPMCGQESIADKIYGGNNTAIDEYPWLALLEYTQNNGKTLLNCGGSLINQRYVLTAAHCVSNETTNKGLNLMKVHLGEYDTSKNIDCFDGICADPVLQVGIEEIILHENYKENTKILENDIALIRLDKEIRYSDFIKPICLPGTNQNQESKINRNFIVAGWGRTLLARRSTIKQKLSISLVDQNICRQKYADIGAQLGDTSFCAGGKFKEDSCDGDSGGPVMKFIGTNWYLEGIVSKGYRCGLDGWPGIYTHVKSFRNWIESNLQP